ERPPRSVGHLPLVGRRLRGGQRFLILALAIVVDRAYPMRVLRTQALSMSSRSLRARCDERGRLRLPALVGGEHERGGRELTDLRGFLDHALLRDDRARRVEVTAP